MGKVISNISIFMLLLILAFTSCVKSQFTLDKEALTKYATDIGNQIIKDEDVFVIERNGLYGFRDANHNILIDPQFENALDFYGGMAIVYKTVEEHSLYSDLNFHSLYGFIDRTGDLVLPYQYIDASDFYDEYASIIDDHYEQHYINKKGEKQFTHVEKEYIYGRSFCNGYAAVQISGAPLFPTPKPPLEEWSYINKTGHFVTDMTFEYAGDFRSEYAVVKKNGKYGVIDNQFHSVIKCKYDNLFQCKGYSLFVTKKGDFWGLIDSKNKTLLKFEYNDYKDIGKRLFTFIR